MRNTAQRQIMNQTKVHNRYQTVLRNQRQYNDGVLISASPNISNTVSPMYTTIGNSNNYEMNPNENRVTVTPAEYIMLCNKLNEWQENASTSKAMINELTKELQELRESNSKLNLELTRIKNQSALLSTTNITNSLANQSQTDLEILTNTNNNTDDIINPVNDHIENDIETKNNNNSKNRYNIKILEQQEQQEHQEIYATDKKQDNNKNNIHNNNTNKKFRTGNSTEEIKRRLSAYNNLKTSKGENQDDIILIDKSQHEKINERSINDTNNTITVNKKNETPIIKSKENISKDFDEKVITTKKKSVSMDKNDSLSYTPLLIEAINVNTYEMSKNKKNFALSPTIFDNNKSKQFNTKKNKIGVESNKRTIQNTRIPPTIKSNNKHNFIDAESNSENSEDSEESIRIPTTTKKGVRMLGNQRVEVEEVFLE